MGAGRGGRGLIESDKVEILSGIRNGITIGSPISLLIPNLDYSNWKNQMAEKKGIVMPISNPRPGHADMAGSLKYGFNDVRNVLERASARETVARVAVGAIVRKLLKELNIRVLSHTIAIGKITLDKFEYSLSNVEKYVKKDPITRCIDHNTAIKMQKEIFTATKNKDTLGGVIEVIAHGVPPGLGSYVHYDRKLDARIAFSLMSIPSVKAVEIGDGIRNSSKVGSHVQDEIFYEKSKYIRKTNHAGGLEGGVTNGEDIICHIFLKPISTIGVPLKTVNIITKKQVNALTERSDICVVPRAGIVCESMLIFTIAESFLEKFGQDNLNDIKNNFANYINSRDI
jgi:chorismate synthase